MSIKRCIPLRSNVPIFATFNAFAPRLDVVITIEVRGAGRTSIGSGVAEPMNGPKLTGNGTATDLRLPGVECIGAGRLTGVVGDGGSKLT